MNDLVVVLQQLDNDLDVGVIVLDGDDSQYIGSVLSVRVFTVLVSQYQTRVGLFDLSIHHITGLPASYLPD